MATLEVHDGRGRVEYVTIRSDRLALIGTDPKCDVVLDDPKALPFHGRIRHKKGVFKVEAFPESKYLELNGQKILASKYVVGDEVRIGGYRIFLINAEDTAGEDEKTVVRPAPTSAGRQEPLPRSWGRKDVAPPSMAAPGPGGVAVADKKKAGQAAPAIPVALWRKVLRTVLGAGQRPGEERLAGSPLVLGLILALAILGLLSLGLYSIIAKSTADRQYQMALDSFNDGDYRNSMALFDLFLKSSPKDDRAGKAKVTRALANVRQYASGGGALWSSALEAANEMFDSVGNLAAYQDSSAELAEVVVRAGESLADRARTAADAKALAEAETASAMLDKIAGEAGPSLRAKSKLPVKIAQGRAAVAKADTRKKALDAMDAALKAGTVAVVYSTRDALIVAYPDLAADKNVIDRLKRGNDLLRKAVRYDAAERSSETTPRAEPLGPPLTLVLRTPSQNAKVSPGPAAPVVHALVDGVAYGLDGGDGSPIWQVDVGLSSPFPPIPVAGAEPGVLVLDARHDELVRIKSKTGEILWRLELGERVSAPPLVLGNEGFQPLPSGKLLRISLSNGQQTGILHFPRPLGPTPAADEAGQFLYLPADSTVLFVLARDPWSCVGVEYIGHEPGTIPCAPARVGRHLILPENRSINEGRWTVLATDEEGRNVRVAQTLVVPGWTWETPPSVDSLVWAATDRMGLTAYAVGDLGAKIPLKAIASTIPDSEPSGPLFARARVERELIVTGGRSARYDLDLERQTISPGWNQPSAGLGAAPVQMAGKFAVLTQQYIEGRGISLSAVNPADASIAWRTILGASWPSGLSASTDGGSLTTLATDGRLITFNLDKLSTGGFVEQPIPEGAIRPIPPGPLRRLEAGDLEIVVPSESADHLLIREGPGPFRRVDLPSPLGASPLIWNGDLLAPGEYGRIFLIDPRTGGSKAEPYVPPYDREKPTRWLAPVKLEGDSVLLADASGHVRRLVRLSDPRPRLSVSTEVDLGSGIVADPAASGDAIVLATADGRVRALAGHDLGPLGAWPLNAPRALGPVSSSNHSFVADSTGTVVAFGPEGRRLWSIDLGDAPPIAAPSIQGDSVLFLALDGTLHRRSLADGSPLERTPLGIQPSGGLWALGSDLAIASAPGSVRMMGGKKPRTP